MPSGWAALAYAGYLLWLLAGLFDFACHRRTGLARTSGVRESMFHLLQLSLVGTAILIGMVFRLGPGTLAIMLVLVCAHSAAAYLDTRSAYGRREIIPVEQHIHSVLDMAPPIALSCAVLAGFEGGSWVPTLRDPPLPVPTWLLVLLPPAVLCVTPALLELRSALRPRTEAPAGGR
jgi:hypothetical protein